MTVQYCFLVVKMPPMPAIEIHSSFNREGGGGVEMGGGGGEVHDDQLKMSPSFN